MPFGNESLNSGAGGAGGDPGKDKDKDSEQNLNDPDSMAACRKPRPDSNSLSVRQYLDQTVGPVLLHGLQALAKERPSDPVTYLATFLLKNKNKCDDVGPEGE
ncbi:hypothetical protein KR009_007355 [Drosophila setifemur]|nr:hypothetical protein KR009_007355 [Drosophila setifemur]